MQSEKEFPLGLVLAIPLLVGLAFNFAPRSQPLEAEIQAAQKATSYHSPAGVVQHLNAILAWEPWRTSLWLEAGLSANEAQDFPAAVRYFQAAAKFGELSNAGRVALGDAYLQSGDWRQAISTWLALVSAGQGEDSLFERILSAQWNHQLFEDAAHTANLWHAKSPQNAQAAFKAGLLASVVDPTKAAAHLGEAARLEPALASQAGSLQAAIATAYQSDHAGYQRVVIGRALANLGYWDLARLSFDAATKLVPEYAEGWAFLGEAQEQLDQDGSQALKQAEALDPNSVIVKALYALWNRQNNQLEAALEQLRQIASAEPGQAVWQIEMGKTTALMGDTGAALAYFQRATVLEPSNPQAWLALADFSAVHQVQTREVGLPAARQALVLAPESAPALDLMGRVMLVLEDMKSAERFLQLAIEKDAGYAAAQLHLAQLYLQENQAPLAYPFLSRAVELAGNDSQTGLLAKRLLSQYFGGQ